MGGYPRARSEDLLTEEVGDELVVYDVATQTAHALSKDAASVWRRCDSHASAKDIARRLGLEQARVSQALEELSAAGLIEEPDGISRRTLYKRAAKVGAAALSAPLIHSVAIPAASAAQSSTCGTFLGGGCDVIWNNSGCSGPPAVDPCPVLSGSASCTCQNLGNCVFNGDDTSRRSGVCM